jgi:hypothetical protein
MLGKEPPAGGVAPLREEHDFDPGEFPTMQGIFYAVWTQGEAGRATAAV